jgi:multicomponent K+:H+ antiporter subunit A
VRRERLFQLHERWSLGWSSPVAFERAYAWATASARRLLGLLDRQTLRQSVLLYLGFTLLLGLWAWSRYPAALAGPLEQTVPDPVALAGLGVLVAGLAGVVWLHRQRLTAILFLSVVGLVVSLAFIWLAAPDLALTQLTVEVASIMLLLLALRYLPAEAPADEKRSRMVRDGVVAGGVGLGISALCLAMLTRPFETISAYHIANAKPLGGGTNVVNVTLVDYRGFDTLGEIAVLAMAALGMQALLSGLVLNPQAGHARTAADRYPIMLRMLMRPLLPLALAVAVYIFLRGHNLPGGGFIAGLVTAIALLLQYVSAGAGFAGPKLRLPFVGLLAAGLLIATATGAGSWIFGQPFLTSSYAYVTLPIVGTFELATAMLFDFGIFLVVLGTLLIALTELGQLSSRERRPVQEG